MPLMFKFSLNRYIPADMIPYMEAKPLDKVEKVTVHYKTGCSIQQTYNCKLHSKSNNKR